ncbi:sensor histidine kinase [Dactylosporangium sp. CA-139066]|uniref:sensor histidine kinase n=1 Tax=Dactylosporangium sp. CA-139066 TaxID=3239930 RepID=UPI003D8E0876
MSWLRRLRPNASGVVIGRAVGTVAYAVAAVVVVPAHLRWVALLCTAVAFAGAAYSWRARMDQPVHRVIGLLVMAAGGHALYVVDPSSPGWLPAGIAISVALAVLPLAIAVPFAFLTAGAGALIAELRNPTAIVPLLAGCTGFAVLGAVVGTSRQRADQAERLLTSEKAAREAEARAQVYAERARLAREIHDILAHTLSAQIVGLQSARLLMLRGAPAEAVLQQIDQAQKLAREGLDETRQAVYSLRGDTRPTADAVRELAQGASAKLTIEGTPEPLTPEAGLAVERTVREALTNVRKHAPGAAVRIRLAYTPDQVEVEVCDGGSAMHSALRDAGTGYGLAGLRERAELLGGKLDAGPVDDGEGYRVWLTIPR